MRTPRCARAAVVVAVVIGAAAASAPARAAPASMTIVIRDFYVSRIGPFRPTENPRLSAARRAFGRPSSVRLDGDICRVTWGRLRLRITFVNLGGSAPGQTTCTPSLGRAQSFVARGARFRTTEGLRVGQPSSAIRERHPAARFADGRWTIVSAVSPFGASDEESPVLTALTRRGHVSALAGYIGGAGE